MDTAEDVSKLLSYQNASGGWGEESDFYNINNVLDTLLALQALKKINYPDQNIISSALYYLTSTQNPDGGFGFYQGDDSNVYMTALVSYTLQQFPKTTSLATAINKATSYLVAHQNGDGGFGSSDSIAYETALAYIALVGETTDNTVLGNAINFLLSTQSLDGSWNQDPYSTALVLRVLAT
jgi:prenyltransferase beta subunit